MTTAETTLHIVKLEYENFLGVKARRIDVNGGHLLVSGPNGAGKTSILQGIFDCLHGTSSKKTPEPIHHGADRATVRVDLGEIIAERTWTEAGTKLTLTAADGSRLTKPQQILDKFLSQYALDPNRFMQERPQDQLDAVLRTCGVAPPIEQVKDITGETFPALPGESAARYIDRLAADHSGTLYVRRLEAGRVADQKRKALDEQRQLLEDLGGALKPDEQPKSAGELLAQMERLQERAEERRAARDAAIEADKEYTNAADRLMNLRSDQRTEEAAILALEKQLAERRATLATVKGRIQKGEAVVADLRAEAEASVRAAEAIADPAPEIAALRARIATVESDNAKTAKRQHAGEQLHRLEADLAGADADRKAHDGALEAVRQLRSHLLDGIDLGIDGLAVGHGELRLNDVPFSQASTAEQFRTALALAMKERPRLRLLRLDGAESLDSESKRMVLDLASDRGFQVVMASVADTEGLRVEIIDAEQNSHQPV